MSAGPWTARLKRFGYVVCDRDGKTVCAFGDSGLHPDKQRPNAVAVAAVPDLLAVLVACEHYFGDRPAKDTDARELHARLFQVLVQAGVPVQDEEE